MKIIMINTATHEKKIVSFDEVCNSYYHGQYNSKGGRRIINYKLLNNETIKDGLVEYKKEIN